MSQTHTRMAPESRSKLYVYSEDFVYVGSMDIVDPNASVMSGTFKVPYITQSPDEVNIFDGIDWQVLPMHPKKKQEILDMPAQIDAIIDDIYKAQIGSKQAEYDLAHEQAKQYKANNYEGAVPSMIASAARARNLTPQQAADEILMIAQVWLTVVEQMREKRLYSKKRINMIISELSVVNYKSAFIEFEQFKKDIELIKSYLTV